MPYSPPTITNQRPQWKRIGEAADSATLFIERIDGFRILVARYMRMEDFLRPSPMSPFNNDFW